MGLKVESNDGQQFEIDGDIAKQSTMLKQYSDEEFDGVIPLPNVKGSLLKPIIDFCDHHKNDGHEQPIDDDDDDDDPNKDIYEPKRSDGISEWDQTFLQQFTVEDGTIFDIIMAANYLGIKSLLGVGCKTIGNMVRGKSVREVNEMFNITHSPPSSINEPTGSDNISDAAEAAVSNYSDVTPETNSTYK